MTTGKRIAMYREQAGIRQTELADKIGISKQLLWKYETDRITNIPLENIEKIASALDIDPSVLTGWDEEEPRDELADLLEELRDRPEMRMLFETSKNMTPEQIRTVVAMLEGFKK